MIKVLHGGPWFIMGHFLSVQNWEPNFVSANSKIQATTIQIRLSQLPIKFYDKEILEHVGMKIGKLLKIDTCTSATLKGRYAQICIQVPIEVPLQISVVIRDHRQPIEYEGEGILCKGCEGIGHLSKKCPLHASLGTEEKLKMPMACPCAQEGKDQKTVEFPRSTRQKGKATEPQKHRQMGAMGSGT